MKSVENKKPSSGSVYLNPRISLVIVGCLFLLTIFAAYLQRTTQEFPIGIVGAFESNVRTSWIINPGRLKTIFGTPITPDQYSHLSIEEFRDLVKGQVVKLVEDFS